MGTAASTELPDRFSKAEVMHLVADQYNESVWSAVADSDGMISRETFLQHISSSSSSSQQQQQLPPIRLIDFDKFKELGQMPRYPDHADITEEVQNLNLFDILVVFISHCWLRGWSGAEGYDGRPHPDNAAHDKYKLLCRWHFKDQTIFSS